MEVTPLAQINVLLLRVGALEAAIRQHRDERGDDRCHADDGRLYAVLPEGDTRPSHETAVTLENCARYIECRQAGREYVSPQRRIEELEAESARLTAFLHRREMHPDYVYATTTGPRKAWSDENTPPEGEGWERNTHIGRNGWERFDYYEEAYWMRRRPAPTEDTPGDAP